MGEVQKGGVGVLGAGPAVPNLPGFWFVMDSKSTNYELERN